MELLYRILADVVVVLHAGVVLFVVLGLAAVLVGGLREWGWVRNAWFRTTHLLTILVIVVQAWCGVLCPLTIWEQQLRRAAGQQTYQGAFIANLVHDLLFVEAPAWVLTALYTAFGAVVLVSLLLVPPRWSVGFRARAPGRG
jgi:polyferredoxin